MNEQDNWYDFENMDTIDSPALLLYKDRIIQNIDQVIGMVDDVNRLRPHVKTNKSVNVCRLMIAKGISKFKCATIAEAEMLGLAGAGDVLLAYQPTKSKLERLLALISAYPGTKYSCLIDNAGTAQMISDATVDAGIMLPVCIDINAGMNRTGIVAQSVMSLYNLISELPGIQLMGLHAYDGHINNPDVNVRKDACEKEFAAIEGLRNEIQSFGNEFPLLIAGGSPTFLIHSARQNTECSPGTFVFWDKNYHDNIPEQHFDYAALVLTRVISLPAEGKICIDLGYKAICCEHGLDKRAYFINAPDLKPIGHSEEHMVLDAGANHTYQIGDILFALPLHVCPTVAMYNNAHVIEQGDFTQKWDITARGRELNY